MHNLTLQWTKKSFNGNDVFYIVCQKYGTVGAVEGTINDQRYFHISWLYIEPFFRIKNGIKILMSLIRTELPIYNIIKISHECPTKNLRNKQNNRLMSSLTLPEVIYVTTPLKENAN